MRQPSLQKLVALTAACGLLSAGCAAPDAANNIEQALPEAQAAPAQPADTSGGATLSVINEASFDLCGLYIAPAGSADFGSNQLPQGGVIVSGTSYQITDIPPGSFDVQVNDCDGAMINAMYGVSIDQAEMSWTIREASLDVINNSSYNLCQLNISPNSSPNWGPNQLDQALAPGQSYSVVLAEGSWDLRMTPCDSAVPPLEELGIDVILGSTYTLTDQ